MSGSKDYICKTECYHRERQWKKGETFTAAPGERVPHHFVLKGGQEEETAPEVEESPVTFKGLQEDEAKAVLGNENSTTPDFME